MTSDKNTTIYITALFLSILVSVPLAVVQANDAKLITHLCSGTSVPLACTSCINNATRAVNTNVDALLSLLDCAYSDSLQLQTDIKSAQNNPKTDKNTKEVLDKCYSLIFSSSTYNAFISLQISQNKFSLAKDRIDKTVIAEELNGCSTLLSLPGVTIPPKVFSGLFSVSSDYSITSQVLSVVH